MLSTLNKRLSENSTLPLGKKARPIHDCIKGNSHQWRYWVVSNYEICEGCLTPTKEILNHSYLYKETIPDPINAAIIGKLISNEWGDQVRYVNRGLVNKRYNAYLNLRRKVQTSISECESEKDRDHIADISANLSGKTFPSGWEYEVVDEENVNFFHRENVEFRGQRLNSELGVNTSCSVTKFKLKSHDCQVDLNDLFLTDEFSTSSLSLYDQVTRVIQYLDKSVMCRGVICLDGARETDSQVTGTFVELDAATNTTSIETRCFSNTCQILSTSWSKSLRNCKNCANLRILTNKRKERQNNREPGPPSKYCNVKYMSKADVAEKLNKERTKRINAEKRAGKKNLKMRITRISGKCSQWRTQATSLKI